MKGDPGVYWGITSWQIIFEWTCWSGEWHDGSGLETRRHLLNNFIICIWMQFNLYFSFKNTVFPRMNSYFQFIFSRRLESCCGQLVSSFWQDSSGLLSLFSGRFFSTAPLHDICGKISHFTLAFSFIFWRNCIYPLVLRVPSKKVLQFC